MKTSIKKWGNSAGVVIPASYLSELNIKIGSLVSMSVVDDAIRIAPIAADFTATCVSCSASVTDSADLDYQEDEIYHCPECGHSLFNIDLVRGGNVYCTESAILRKGGK